MRRIGIIISVFMLMSGLSATCLADCRSDVNCSGFVDGADLAVFAAEFGDSCPSVIAQPVGTIQFQGLAPLPLYEFRLHVSNPVDAATVMNDLIVIMGQSYQTAQLAQWGANRSVLAEIQLTIDDQQILTLEAAQLTSLTYLPPENGADPYRIGATIAFERLAFNWNLIGANWNKFGPFECCSIGDRRLIQSVGFQGDLSLIPAPNETISSFVWEFDLSGLVPELLQIRTVGPLTASGPCLFSVVVCGNSISEVNIQKWGGQIDDQPVSDIIMQTAIPTDYALYTDAQGTLVHEVTFQAERIEWTEGGFDDHGTWQTSSGTYEPGAPQ